MQQLFTHCSCLSKCCQETAWIDKKTPIGTNTSLSLSLSLSVSLCLSLSLSPHLRLLACSGLSLMCFAYFSAPAYVSLHLSRCDSTLFSVSSVFTSVCLLLRFFSSF